MTSAQSYRKRPVEVQAIQWTGENPYQVQDFVGVFHREDGGWFNGFVLGRTPEPVELWSTAKDEWITLEVGEWIVRDVHGIYPCPDEAFQEDFIPVLDVLEPITEDMDIDRVLGRVRFSLVQTVSMSEVDTILEILQKGLADEVVPTVVEELTPVKPKEEKPAPTPQPPKPRQGN